MKYAWTRFELFISKWKVYHSHKCLINSHHNIAEILLKLVLSANQPTI